MKELFAVVLSWVAIAAVLSAQTKTLTADYSCVESLELPTRGLLASTAGTSGTVHAAVRIGKDGQINKLDLTGANRVLQAEVRVAMNLSKFAVQCEGKSLDFIFAFTLEDPATDHTIPPGRTFCAAKQV